MKKFFLLIPLLILPVSAQMNISNPFFVAGTLKPAAAGGGGPLSDDFTGDGDISGRVGTGFTWVESAGSMDTSGGQLRSVTGSFAKNMANTDTDVGAANHYVLVTIVSIVANGFPHVVMRYTDSSSGYYSFEMGTANGNWAWYKYDSAADTTGNQIGLEINLTHAANDKWGLTIEGTGDATVVRIWKNPTANTPVSASEWDIGDTTPDGSWTDNPGANAVDTGQKVGLKAFTSGANEPLFDNFYADGL